MIRLDDIAGEFGVTVLTDIKEDETFDELCACSFLGPDHLAEALLTEDTPVGSPRTIIAYRSYRLWRRGRAFTLVELLVVIGIIGILISILMPALNKARQQAGSLACESNLHQIGLLLEGYVAENKGWLPYGHAAVGGQPYWAGGVEWNWADTLMLRIKPRGQVPDGPNAWAGNAVSNQAFDFNGLFHDRDLPAIDWGNRACDYVANIRILVDANQKEYMDQIGDHYLALRKMSSIRSSASVAMIWCGGTNIYYGYDTGANACSWEIDQSQINWGSCMLNPAGYSWANSSQVNLIALSPISGTSSFAGNVTLQTLGLENHDSSFNWNPCDMRFRHLGDKACNLMFVDGHVETRMLGSVYGSEINVNPPTALAPAP